MKHLFTFSFLLLTALFYGCYPLQQTNSGTNYVGFSNLEYKDKYVDFIDPTEKIVDERYHYVITQDTSGIYIKRTFFPETKTMTAEVRYRDRGLRIKDGKATYWNENGNMKSHGNYVNNKEDGNWKYYHRKTGELSQIGDYQLGDKVGDWKFYDDRGRLTSEKTFVANQKEGKFIVYDTLSNIINAGIYKADTIYEQSLEVSPTPDTNGLKVVETMPRFYNSECEQLTDLEEKTTCSQTAMLKYIYSNLRYPANARNHDVEGMTITQFVIDTTGAIIDIDCIQGISTDLRDESLKVIKTMNNWVPGEQRGKKVKVSYTLPIRFKLE